MGKDILTSIPLELKFVELNCRVQTLQELCMCTKEGYSLSPHCCPEYNTLLLDPERPIHIVYSSIAYTRYLQYLHTKKRISGFKKKFDITLNGES